MKTQFNPEQVINLIQSAGKIGGAILATHGLHAQNLWAGWVGLAITAISVWFSHHSAGTAPPTSAIGPAADNTSKLPPVVLCGLLAFAMAAVPGCSTTGESQRIHAGVTSNGIGYKEVTTSTNGVKTTNSFKFTLPINLTNAVPMIEGAFE